MTRQSYNIVISIGVAIAAIVLGAWGFVFNYGTLEIRASAPYTVSIGNKSTLCITSLCSFELAPGVYNFNVVKEGFLTYKGSTIIKRWRTTEEDVALQFIPVVNKLEKWPSDGGRSGGDGGASFLLKDNSILMQKNRDGSLSQIAVFNRPFKNFVLLESDVFALIYEVEGDIMSAYIVNSALKSKRRILQEKGVLRAKWGPSWILFEGADGVFAIDVYSGERRELEIENLDRVMPVLSGAQIIYFISAPVKIRSYDFLKNEYSEVLALEGLKTYPDEMAQSSDGKSIIMRFGKEIREILLMPR